MSLWFVESHVTNLKIISIFLYSNSPDTCSTLQSKSCTWCNCDPHGSASTNCDKSGKCKCKDDYYGKKCNNKDCDMGEWTEWSNCPCGVAGVRRRRSRIPKSLPTWYGIRCPTENVQYTTCEKIACKCQTGFYGDLCQDRDCTLTSWTSWKECTPCPTPCVKYKCTTAIPKHEYRSRERRVQIQKAGNGKCEGEKYQSAYCGYCKTECLFGIVERHSEKENRPFRKCSYTRDYEEPIE